jgi:Fur family transcriptional regulator, ferric uptake regulator
MKRREPAPMLGHRNTRQRDHIHQVIQDAQGPLTVQEIHERAQREVTGLGIATVYRTLNLLLEKEHIQSVILPSGETRYERSDLGHHHHFHCRVCDEVFDLATCPVSIPDGNALGPGYVVESHELTLYGICPRCGPQPGV